MLLELFRSQCRTLSCSKPPAATWQNQAADVPFTCRVPCSTHCTALPASMGFPKVLFSFRDVNGEFNFRPENPVMDCKYCQVVILHLNRETLESALGSNSRLPTCELPKRNVTWLHFLIHKMKRMLWKWNEGPIPRMPVTQGKAYRNQLLDGDLFLS